MTTGVAMARAAKHFQLSVAVSQEYNDYLTIVIEGARQLSGSEDLKARAMATDIYSAAQKMAAISLHLQDSAKQGGALADLRTVDQWLGEQN